MDRAETVIANVGARIAELRRERGWTQQEAADRLRMEVQSLQRLERGENLTLRSLVKIANTLGVPAAALLLPAVPHAKRPGRPPKPVDPPAAAPNPVTRSRAPGRPRPPPLRQE